MNVVGTFLVLVFSLWRLQCSEEQSSVVHYSVLTVHPGGFNIEIYLDKTDALSSSISHPVLIFFTGFGSTAPSLIYSQVLTKVVQQTSNGLIVIALSQEVSIDPNVTAANVKQFFDFISNPNNTGQLFLPDYPNVTLDINNRLGVFVCESGIQSIVLYLNQQCGPVKLFATLDPTDGLYELYQGDATNTALMNAGHLPFHTPTLIIASGLASISYSIGEIVTGPCSAQNVSSNRFYNLSSASINAPTFFINFTQYGLGDTLNQPLIGTVKTVVCNACKSHSEYYCDYEQHQYDTAQLVAHFVLGIFNRNSSNLILLENANQYFQNVTNTYQLNNYYLTNQGGFCTHD